MIEISWKNQYLLIFERGQTTDKNNILFNDLNNKEYLEA